MKPPDSSERSGLVLRHHWKLAVTTAAGLATLTAAATGLAGPPAALPGSGPASSATAPVSPKPASGTPELAKAGNTTERVRQLVQCGATMYAVGSFTKIDWHGMVYHRHGIFGFRATAPFTVSGWDPHVTGALNSIAFSGGNCADAYIGGKFTAVHGTKATDIAEISTSTGSVVPSFGHTANGQVETLLATGGHILVGGYYTKISGSTKDKYMTSLNPTTGADDRYLRLHISGHYTFTGADSNTTRVYNQQLSHDGRFDLVEGDFTSVGGRARQQVFMLRLPPGRGKVTGWTSAEFSKHCVKGHPFYVQAGGWSPDDSTVYTASTGGHRLHWHHRLPLTGLCDTAAAFPATTTTVNPTWINYTGCYSLYTVAADPAAVYVAGHEKYANNPNGCKSAGRGAVPAPGLGGLRPHNGRVLRNPAGDAGRFSRSRGTGADDMLLTGAGLWVASDNGLRSGGRFHLSDRCGSEHGHAGICFLPYH
jgi:hypothetical protein